MADDQEVKMRASDIEIPIRGYAKLLDVHPRPWTVKPVFKIFHLEGFEVMDNQENRLLWIYVSTDEIKDLQSYEQAKTTPVETWLDKFSRVVKIERILQCMVEATNEAK